MVQSYLNILNRFGLVHQFAGQTDELTDGIAMAIAASYDAR